MKVKVRKVSVVSELLQLRAERNKLDLEVQILTQELLEAYRDLADLRKVKLAETAPPIEQED